MNIIRTSCFLGFSVTAENNGYVEKFADMKGALEVSKLGLGGVHPHHARYLLSRFIDESHFDLFVLEFSTSAFRKFLSRKEYVFSLVYLINKILHKGAKVGILDLPRSDVDITSDWVHDLHKTIAERFNIPWLSFDAHFDKSYRSNINLLRDEVHTTSEGSNVYAQFLVDNWDKFNCIDSFTFINKKYAHVYSSIPANDLVPFLDDKQTSNYLFNRSGYEVNTQVITPKVELCYINSFEGMTIDGCSFLMGPQSGKIYLEIDGQKTFTIEAYDGFCYYTRLGCIKLPSTHFSKLKLSQCKEIPEVQLHKGDRDVGPRVGYIGDLFVSTELVPDFEAVVAELGVF